MKWTEKSHPVEWRFKNKKKLWRQHKMKRYSLRKLNFNPVEFNNYYKTYLKPKYSKHHNPNLMQDYKWYEQNRKQKYERTVKWRKQMRNMMINQDRLRGGLAKYYS